MRGNALEGTSCWLDGLLPSFQNKAERPSAAFFIPDLPLNTPRVIYVQLLEGSEILSWFLLPFDTFALALFGKMKFRMHIITRGAFSFLKCSTTVKKIVYKSYFLNIHFQQLSISWEYYSISLLFFNGIIWRKSQSSYNFICIYFNMHLCQMTLLLCIHNALITQNKIINNFLTLASTQSIFIFSWLSPKCPLKVVSIHYTLQWILYFLSVF